MRCLSSMVVLLMLGIPVGLAGDSQQNSVRAEMLVSTDWLVQHLNDPGVVVLCVATNPDFYTKGHIPRAHLISLSDIVTTRDGISNELPAVERLQSVFARAGVKNDARIVLYGQRQGMLAARAYFTLDYLGLADRAALLDGGIEKWRAEKRPESLDLPNVTPHPLKVTIHPEVLVNAGAVQEALKQPARKRTVALMDGRPAEEFTGERLSEDVSTAGHIPSASSLYWMNNLVSKENPVLRPPGELRKLYAQAGANGVDVITYCRTGMQSSFDYFVAKYLGYRVSMYDGSFLEWSRKGLPVEKTERNH
ncbi:MAG TPA: sulfurtransferase [Terriglobales bacterium]